MKILSLEQAIDLSLADKSIGEQDADFKINIGRQAWLVYKVSISHRDILCYCDQGTATFLVDSFGDKNFADLFDWSES